MAKGSTRSPSFPPETQFRPAKEDEDETEYTVITLLAEDPEKGEYLVEWGDIDPKTGYNYPPSWEPKDSCTNDLIIEWKGKLAEGKAEKGRDLGIRALREWNKTARREIKKIKAEKKEKKKKGNIRKKSEGASTTNGTSRAGSGVPPNTSKAGPSTIKPPPAKKDLRVGNGVNVSFGTTDSAPSTQIETFEDPTDETYSDGMEVLNSPVRDAKKKGKGKEKEAGENIGAGGKRKRTGEREASEEPISKKKRGAAGGRENSETASATPDIPNKSTKRKAIQDPDSSPPIASRVRSRSVSTTLSNTAAAVVRAGVKSKPNSTSTTGAVPTAKQPRKSGKGGFGSHYTSPARANASRLVSGNGEGKSGDAISATAQEEPAHQPDSEPEYDDPPFENNHDDPEPIVNLSPDAQHAARLNTAIRNAAAERQDQPAEAVKNSKKTSSLTFAEPSKSRASTNAVAGPSRFKPPKALQSILQPDTQVFRDAAHATGRTGGVENVLTQTQTQESINQFSSPPDGFIPPSRKDGRDLPDTSRVDPDETEDDLPTVLRKSTQEPLFLSGGSDDGLGDNNEADDDAMGESDTGSLPPGIERVMINGVMNLRGIADPVDKSAEGSLSPGKERVMVDGETFIRPRADTADVDDSDDDAARPPPAGLERVIINGIPSLQVIGDIGFTQTQLQPFTYPPEQEVSMVDRGSSAQPELVLPVGVKENQSVDIRDEAEVETASRPKSPTPPSRPIMTDRATSAEPLPEPAQPPPSPPRAVMTDRGTSAEREVEVTVTTVVEPMDDTSMEAPTKSVFPIPTADQLAEVADLSARCTTLESDNTGLQRRVASLNKDVQFAKSLYDQASSRAVEEADLNRELTKKLKIKESQLINGLKQKDLHSAAVRTRDQQLIATLQAQNKILLDQARRTDDALRTKAVQFPRVKRDNERLLEENSSLERRVESLSKRNNELLDQVQGLRARQMGVIQGYNDDDGDHYDGSQTDTGSYTSDEEDGQDMAGMGYATRPINMTSSGEYYESAPDGQVEGEIQVKEEEIDFGEVVDGPGLAFECQIRSEEGDAICGQLLESRDILQKHWSSHHRAQSLSLH